jgi:MYXO-CTERM domain-containing protein
MRTVLIAVSLFLWLATYAQAAEVGSVVINEIAWAGMSDTSDEWIELYNTTGGDIDLSDWSLTDDDFSYIFDAVDCVGECVIPANGYFLIERREEATSLPANYISYIDLMVLSNSGERLELKDELDQTIDLVDCTNGWFAGDNTNDLTMEKKSPTLDGNQAGSWADNVPNAAHNGTDSNGNLINGTPMAENSVVGGPKISHLHSIDLTAIDLYFNTELEQTSAELVSNYLLNNGTDDLQPTSAVLDPSDNSLVHLTGLSGLSSGTLSTITISGIEEQGTGLSGSASAMFYAGLVEISFVRNDADSSLIPDIHETYPYAFLTTQGIISDAGTFHSSLSFIQDDTAGVAVFDADVGALAVGDVIRVSGWIINYLGQDEIISVKHSVIEQNQLVQPVATTLAEYNSNPEQFEGMLLYLAEVHNDNSGDAWPVDEFVDTSLVADVNIADSNGGNSTVLRIDGETDIDGTEEPAWPIDLAGIARQESFAAPPSDGYFISPRSITDIDYSYCPDNDQDGFAALECGGLDCDDTNELINPEAGELCNQIDDDCDDSTDEDFPLLGQVCDGDDTDTCENGTYICNQTQDDVICHEESYENEICNGLDDDCDGQTDEDWPLLNTACDRVDDTDECKHGSYVCSDSGTSITCDESGPGYVEECDGSDNDCDGQTDEDLGTITCGQGACLVEVNACENGEQPSCVPLDKPETREVTCDDGIDNDCDGLTDLADVTSCSDPDIGKSSCGCAAGGDPASLMGLLSLLSLLALSRRRYRKI